MVASHGPWPWQQVVKPSVTLQGPPAVAGLLRDDSDHWLFIDQPRYPVRAWTREGVAGKIDPSPTSSTGWEDPLATMIRETIEEVGFEFPTWYRLATNIWASPGFSNETWNFFLGQGNPNEVQRRPADEYISRRWHQRPDGFDPLLNKGTDRLSDLKTVVMAWLFEFLEESVRFGRLNALQSPRL